MMCSTLNKNITSNNYIRDGFETTFLKIPLDEQLKYCDSDELVSLFNRYLPGYQPILEAGSGSGRWVAWFIKKRLALSWFGLERSTLRPGKKSYSWQPICIWRHESHALCRSW